MRKFALLIQGSRQKERSFNFLCRLRVQFVGNCSAFFFNSFFILFVPGKTTKCATFLSVDRNSSNISHFPPLKKGEKICHYFRIIRCHQTGKNVAPIGKWSREWRGVPLKRNDFFDKKYNREKKGFVLHVGKGVVTFGNPSILWRGSWRCFFCMFQTFFSSE